ncbi:MAG: DUF4180 domain-containing protein [Clostridia bacterium]
MKIEKIVEKDTVITLISGEDKVINDTQSALDLIMTIKYEENTNNIVIDKRLIDEKFFILSTGLAGEILQKFMNYNVRMAVYGDYSKYTSKPLRDFIYESNNGKNFFFVETKEEAIKKLCS